MDRTLAVIGSASVGKSALTIRFINKTFSTEYDPTIARSKPILFCCFWLTTKMFETFDLTKAYSHTIQANGIDYKLTVCDTAGLEKQSCIPQSYINSHGFILVYSIADKSR